MRSRQPGCAVPGRQPRNRRDPETRQVERLLARAAHGGGAIAVLRGPGAGKSPSLPRAARLADERGMRILKAKGADDARPLAGLRRILEPVLPRIDELAPSQSHELRVALGMEEGPRPEPLRVAFGVLDVLAAVALDAPVVVIADDLHRFDRCSADVLCIAARWLRSDPVVVLLAGRAGRSSVLTGASIEQLKLGTFGPGRMAKQRCDSTPRRAYEPVLKRDG